MKPSRYNILFKYENANVGFNSFSQQFIMLDPLLVDLYEAGVKHHDFSELEKVHPDFYNFLIDQGFLVNEDLDEFERVKNISKEIDNDSSHFHLIINPTMNCNFKCWYCYETHIKDSKMDESTIKATINLAKKVVENQEGLKSFSISFFGGEPLLYFTKVIKPILIEVFDICRLNGIHFSCGMTTNGLLINEEILEVCKNYSLNGFQITLDGNKEQHDKVRFISEGRGSYDKIVSNIILVAKNKLTANVRINCSKDTMNGLEAVINSFQSLTAEERNYIHFDIHKVWQVEDDIEDGIVAFRDYLRANGFATTSGVHDTVIDSCYADKRYQATINYNGEVFKCTARDFVPDSGVGVLGSDGSIAWNEKFEKRMNIKFNNAPCKECRILPICGGGCSQQAIEHEGTDYCVYGFDEEAKLQQVKNKLKVYLTS